MLRYFRLWWAFAKISLMADLEYRTNIVVRVISELFWYLMQLSVFEVLYTHTNTISGWTVNDMRVFMATLFLTDVIFMILLQENMEFMWNSARKGTIDLYLTKPVNSQFMLSLRKVSCSYIINLFLICGYFVWAVSRVTQSVSVWQILTFLVLLVLSVIIAYAMRFMFSTINLLATDAGSIQFIWHQLYRLATRPDPFYPSFVRMMILTFFPVAFFASVPSRVIVEGFDASLLATATGLAILLLYLSNRFWEFALRRYASVSS